MDFSASLNMGDMAQQGTQGTLAKARALAKNLDGQENVVKEDEKKPGDVSSSGAQWNGDGDALVCRSDEFVLSSSAVILQESVASPPPKVSAQQLVARTFEAAKQAAQQTFSTGCEESFSANRLIAAIGQLKMMMGGTLLDGAERRAIIDGVRTKLTAQNQAAVADSSYNKMISQVLMP